MIWFKNTSGKHDSMLTFSIVGFAFVLLKILLAGMVIQLMGKELNFGSIDGSSIAAILSPTFGAYVARRYTDRKYGGDPLPGAEAVKKDTQRDPYDEADRRSHGPFRGRGPVLLVRN